MKNGLLIFFGSLFVIVLSWAGVVLTSHRQFGGVTQYHDQVDDAFQPLALNGVAAQGNAVYQDLGCVTCHTQQVRRAGLGADVERNWGTRQSVARDYIRESAVLVGSSRIGPDLRNVGGRPYADAEYFYKILYAPESVQPGSKMPAYKFLFDVRPLGAGQASPKALKLTGRHAAPAGYEIVPTPRAEKLVAYLRSLNDTYEFPEARPFTEPKAGAEKKEGSH